MKTLTKTAVALTALGMSLALSVPAQATTADKSESSRITEVVKYNDLNLATPEGASMLYSRLRAAVWRVCREAVPVTIGSSRFERLACARELIDTAVKDVNRPALTALHLGRASDDLTARR